MPRGLGTKEIQGAAPVAPTNGFADPHLMPGQDFHPIDLGNGNVIALCPACYKAAVESILADLAGALASSEAVNWNSVNWNSVNWNSVNWNSVNWNSGKS